MAKYDVSVVIPIYNVAKYLDKCINSIRNQSKESIEIICVDDCSTDESIQILEKASLEDNRIRIIRNGVNRGLLYTRKCGAMAAEGKYIMFLDGDDFYTNDACATAYHATVKYGTDILQFGMNILNVGNASQFEVDSFTRFVVPYDTDVIQGNVLDACFMDEKYNYNVVNKIYRASLCKKAFGKLDDHHYFMAEDMLAYFALAYFADTYMGIPDKLYNYNFAIGVSKPGRLDLEGLDKRCCGADSITAVKRFLDKQRTFDRYEEVYKRMERRILSDNFDAWYYRLPFEERDKGYAVFEKHWGKEKVILGLLYDIENKQFDINQKRSMIEEKNQELKNRNDELAVKSRELDEKTRTIEKLNCVRAELLRELDDKNELVAQKQNDIEALKTQAEQLRMEIVHVRDEKESVEGEYEHTLQSLSYKVGRIVTWVPRMIARGIRRIKRLFK